MTDHQHVPGGCTPVPVDFTIDPEDTVAACEDAAGARHVLVRSDGWHPLAEQIHRTNRIVR